MPPVCETEAGTRHIILVNDRAGSGEAHFRAFADPAAEGKSAAQALSTLLHSCYSVVARAAQIQFLLGHTATIILNANL